MMSSWLTITAGNHRDVVRTIFSYISLLRTSISSFPSYFEELKELSEIFFRNREKSQPHTYAISLTRRLEEDQPAQWLLNADSLYREYSEVAVNIVLDCLFPERARLTLSAKDHRILVETNQIDWQKERWYGTEYTVQKFGPDMLEKVSSRVTQVTQIAHSNVQSVVISGLHLPPPNHFIPNNLEVSRDGVSTVGHSGELCKVVVTPFLGPSIPGLYFGDGFAPSLVQTGQYILGSKGSCVHRSEIVGHKVQYDEPC